MRLGAIATTKIEGDVIEAFVRHTLRFVDRLVIVDNDSLDDTRAILQDLIAEGLAVTVWEGEPVTADPANRTRNARRALVELGVDYLLLLDVDELLMVPSRAAFEAELAALPPGANALVEMRTYVPSAGDDPAERNPVARIRHRLVREAVASRKVFIARSFAENPEAIVIPGNHAVEDPSGRSCSALLPTVMLAHYPARSIAQLRNKAVLGWPRFLAMGFDPKGEMAYHWRALNEDLERGGAWSYARFLAAANDYHDVGGEPIATVLDPLPAPACRYLNREPEPLATAVAFTRQMAVAYARLHRERNVFARRSGEDVAHRYRDLLAAVLIGDDDRARERVEAMRAVCERAANDGVGGDVVIAGVRRAETAAMARAVFTADTDERRVWLADSFAGPPPPNLALFPMDAGRDRSGPFDDGDAVRGTLERAAFLDDAMVFVEGWFDKTLGRCPVERIAVLAADVGTYGGTHTILESLYTRVAPAGWVAILTYGSSPQARAAVDAFRAKHRIEAPFERLAGDAACWQI